VLDGAPSRILVRCVRVLMRNSPGLGGPPREDMLRLGCGSPGWAAPARARADEGGRTLGDPAHAGHAVLHVERFALLAPGLVGLHKPHSTSGPALVNEKALPGAGGHATVSHLRDGDFLQYARTCAESGADLSAHAARRPSYALAFTTARTRPHSRV
jgi:hypothetical protein